MLVVAIDEVNSEFHIVHRLSALTMPHPVLDSTDQEIQNLQSQLHPSFPGVRPSSISDHLSYSH